MFVFPMLLYSLVHYAIKKRGEILFVQKRLGLLTYRGQIPGNQKQSTPSLKQLSMIASRLESLKRFTRIHRFVLTLFCFFVSNDSTDIKVLLHNDHKEVGIGYCLKKYPLRLVSFRNNQKRTEIVREPLTCD